MPYINKDELLNSLSDEDVIKLCTELGNGKYKRDGQGNLCFNTSLCHLEGDSPNKLIYYAHPNTDLYPNRKTPIMHCFTCTESYDLVGLVIRAKRLSGQTFSYYQALNYIAQITGHSEVFEQNGNYKPIDLIKDFDWLNKIKQVQNRRKKGIPQLKIIPETYLECFTYLPHDAWLNDGINKESIERYEIGYYSVNNQITIPHRDMQGNLIGIRGRYLDEEDVDNIGKYVPISLNGYTLSHSLGSVLYGAWVTKDKIKECRKALVVEGEKSCLKAYSMFHDNSYVVATCGSNITLTHQKILLNELGVEEIIYMPDKDYKGTHDSFAAEAWFNKQKKKLAPFVPYCKTYLMADTQDTWEYKSNALDFNDVDKFIEEYDRKILITTDDL